MYSNINENKEHVVSIIKWLIISNDEAAFECRPKWQQVSLVW
jgi:hypothetical protein